ncbi:succinate dehydrogenase assembly factor 2 [Paracoccus sp. (in: a-proteobacteria)]|uniref:FAD assembly factor SdhE n=1 Tax=Paracoccus sp. TaxID=267 RepID=UPI0035B0CFC7
MEDHETRLRRLRMRSWRRGMKEMDLILGPFSDSELATLGKDDLDRYESLLDENDQDLYPWITARLGDARPGPAPLLPMLDRVARFAHQRLARK